MKSEAWDKFKKFNSERKKPMRFKAHYIQQSVSERKRLDYWRTIDADNVNEATDIAKHYQRKGYMLGAVIQNLGKD